MSLSEDRKSDSHPHDTLLHCGWHQGLTGAVDYVVKPTELIARMASAQRRRKAAEPVEPFVLGDLTINYPARPENIAGRQLQLTTMEYRLLAELPVNAGKVLTYEHLLGKVRR